MDHNDIRHTLSEYLDNNITPQERAEIEEHLKTCQECASALSELQKTVEHIKTVEEITPPAWLTQKIMTKVRAEAETKKSLFEKLFLPLSIKLPLQAVAVVFLAVTAFYMYQSIQPSPKYAEQELAATKDSSPAATQERRKVDDSLLRAKQIPQTPEYKALDRREEYTATPNMRLNNQLGATAPAPAKPAEQLASAQKEMSREQPAVAPQALGKTEMQDKDFAAGATSPSEAKRAAAPTKKAKTASIADSNTCLSYEPLVVTVSGSISRKDFPGRPNYESIAKGDERETYWVLQLDRTACVLGDKETMNASESSITNIQLVLNSAQYKKYQSLLMTPVTVTGTLFHAHTGHHHTSVLMNVSEIAPLRRP